MIVFVAAPAARTHGDWAHVHVTGWAIESLPEGELRDFFADPEVFDAALFGAAFTDSGYWPQGGDLAAAARGYGEHTHWEPFIQDAVEWIRAKDPPPFDTLEAKKRVAFLMGCASHGMQDEIFDSLFLFQVAEHDGGGQDAVDPGTDGFLVLDGHLRFFPSAWVPYDMLLELYAELEPTVTRQVIEQAVGVMVFAYLNDTSGPDLAEQLGRQYEEAIPWAREHYLDPEVPGSIASEVEPTARYLEALWERFHGRFSDEALVIHSWPEADGYLRGATAGNPDAWVTLVFGKALRPSSGTFWWSDADGADVAFDLDGTRWGGAGRMSRLARMKPTADLAAGEGFSVGLEAGAALIDGLTTTAGYDLAFRAPCAAGPCEDDEDGSGGGEDAGEVTSEGGADDGVGGEAPYDTGSGCSASPGGLPLFLALPTLLMALSRRRYGFQRPGG